MNRRPKPDEAERLDDRAREVAKTLWTAAVLDDEVKALEGVRAMRALMRDCCEFAILVRLPWDGGDLEPKLTSLREPCKSCGWTVGIVRPLKGQRIVRCAACERHQYTTPDSQPKAIPADELSERSAALLAKLREGQG